MNMMREAKVRIADAARKEKQKNAVAPSKISAAAAGETDREREIRMAKEAAEQLKAEQEALAANWIPSPDEEVKINSTGMSGKVVSVDGSTVTVQAGRMQVKVNVDDISQVYTPSSTGPKMTIKKVRGASLAARRADDLLATSGRVSKPPPASGVKNSFGDFNLSDDDLRATVGDNVIVKKSGFKGKVIDDEDGLLTVQAGPNRVLALAHTVEIVATSQKTVSKKKKGKKVGFNLPNATNNEAPKPSAETSASSLAALQAKFGKKN
jgi:dsDNA-specific endonuclease/ATPase MutS2